jgi:hypothetical protein
MWSINVEYCAEEWCYTIRPMSVRYCYDNSGEPYIMPAACSTIVESGVVRTKIVLLFAVRYSIDLPMRWMWRAEERKIAQPVQRKSPLQTYTRTNEKSFTILDSLSSRTASEDRQHLLVSTRNHLWRGWFHRNRLILLPMHLYTLQNDGDQL